MTTTFEARLRALADVVVRVGLNLQPGQRLLIAEPYELQGVARSAEVIVDAVRAAALDGAETPPEAIEVIWGDGARLRDFAARKDWRGYTRLVAANAGVMQSHIERGNALLFLQGFQARLMDGVAPASVAESRRIAWEHFGPVAQQLVAGATNWTVAPAPSPGWAGAAYADLPSAQRLEALWADVFVALRVPLREGDGPTEARPGRDGATSTAFAAWQHHLYGLQRRRDELNSQNLTALRYQGEGTDLNVALPAGHLWCTACLTTKAGVPFVANLPTEEVFTAPLKDSADGTVRVARPVNYGGSTIDGIELEFRRGQVVKAGARIGGDLLQQLLGTDEGAGRLGEVAIVDPVAAPTAPANRTDNSAAIWPRSNRLFYHPLLDENSAHHVALGEAYPFCLPSAGAGALNRSLIHVDLPLNARVTSSGAALA